MSRAKYAIKPIAAIPARIASRQESGVGGVKNDLRRGFGWFDRRFERRWAFAWKATPVTRKESFPMIVACLHCQRLRHAVHSDMPATYTRNNNEKRRNAFRDQHGTGR